MVLAVMEMNQIVVGEFVASERLCEDYLSALSLLFQFERSTLYRINPSCDHPSH